MKEIARSVNSFFLSSSSFPSSMQTKLVLVAVVVVAFVAAVEIVLVVEIVTVVVIVAVAGDNDGCCHWRLH